MVLRLAALTAILVLAPPSTVSAQGKKLTGEEIIRRVDSDHRAESERARIEMVIVFRGGERETRQVEMYFKRGEGDDDQHLYRFVAPSNIRGTALLTVEASGRTDDQWVYLPAIKKAKRIAAGKRSNRFAQTDFTYEDLRTEDFPAFTYERKDDAKVVDTPCYVVEARPNDPRSSGYSKRRIYVEKSRFLTRKVEFFDKKGRHQKTLTNAGHEKVGGLWRITKGIMTDHRRKTKTVWRFSGRKINAGLSDSTFTVGNLERGL